jgi:hypothetical protein
MADEQPEKLDAKPKTDEEVTAEETPEAAAQATPDEAGTESEPEAESPDAVAETGEAESTPVEPAAETAADAPAEGQAVDEEPEPTDAELAQLAAPEAPAGADETTEDALPDPLEGMSEAEIEDARQNEVAFSWQASEYVNHNKGAAWYGAMFGGLGVILIIIALLHDWITIAAFVVMGVALFIYARKPPRTLTYELTPKGITIEGKQYPFAEFRSFGVLKEPDWHTLDLEPVKRFSPRLNVLYDPEDYDAVVGHLELHLPRTDRDPDLVERLARYVRF